MVLNSDIWKFEMNEFELEDFPQETKKIFMGRELDNNPVLWIRVDPDMEYIRKVKVVQEKRNNWLFQLLRENDIIGQIEAVRQLHKYNDDLVYEILKTVARNENYFFKVRKEVLKALSKMEITYINKYISHEMFLMNFFNSRNFDDVTGFYKENKFNNLLEYYLDRSLLKAISRCKEEKLPLISASQKMLEKLVEEREKWMAQGGDHTDSKHEDSKSNQPALSTSNAGDRAADADDAEGNKAAVSGAIQINLFDNQIVGAQSATGDGKGNASGGAFGAGAGHKLMKEKFDEKVFKVTTDTVAQMLLKVLEQNDNSENAFDDSFYLKDILASLGRLDNLPLMPKIATEIFRQFKLDQISNSSPQFAITIGAIKGYYNMRK